jgi:hypothetical protein
MRRKKICRDKIKPKTEVTLLETIVNLGMHYKTFYMLFIVLYGKLLQGILKGEVSLYS